MLHDLAYLDPAFDQTPPDDGPSTPLFLCTTPRSGSHRLGRALFDLGLGVQEEYLHAKVVRILGDRWGLNVDPQSPGSLRSYWRQVCRRRSRSGFVVASVFGSHLRTLEGVLASEPAPVFVHLYRRSVGDQLASLLALFQTKAPYEGAHRAEDIPDISEISSRSIRLLYRSLELQKDKWRRFLADKPHLSIASEDFFRRPEEALRAIVAHCGAVVPAVQIAAAAASVERSRAYSRNAAIKRQILEDHAATFASLGEPTG
jgi:LPS sulfotransferase NodH